MSVSLHLTSVWLCMSVVFVVTVQWPIDTKVTSPFSFIAKHLSLQHEFENNVFFKLPKPAKYLKNMTTGNEKV